MIRARRARLLVPALLVCGALAQAVATWAKEPVAAPNRWEETIARFEEQDQRQMPPEDGVLFVGSSSIVGWDVQKSFSDLPVIKRGFGGSQLSDSVHFAERIILPYKPRTVVVYAGDNDLASGKSPEQVAADYQALVAKIHAALPETRIVYIAIKPSGKRWALIDKIRQANALIRQKVQEDPRRVFVDVEPPMLGADGKPKTELFKPDALHLNEAGYRLWTDLVRPHLDRPAQ